MTTVNVRALVTQAPEPPELGLRLPDLSLPEGRREAAGWMHAYGPGAILPLCRSRLAQDPKDIHVWLLQTECLVHQGLFGEARESVNSALALDTHNVAAKNLRALITSEDLKASVTDAASTQDTVASESASPSHADALAMAVRAKDLYLRGDGQALAMADRAAALDPQNVLTRMVQCELTAQLVGREQSLPHARALLALAPKSPAALFAMIRAQAPPLLASRPLEQAAQSVREHYDMLVAQAPGTAWACMAAVQVGICGGVAAQQLIDGCAPWRFEEGPMLSMALTQARAQADAGQKHAAMATLDRAAQKFGAVYGIFAMKAELHAALGNTMLCMDSLKRAQGLASGDRYVDATLQIAGLLISEGKHDGATQELQRVLAADAKNGEGLLMLAQLKLRLSGEPHAQKQQLLADTQALAERALLADALYHPQAHYLIGLAATDMTLVRLHLKKALAAFTEATDGPRKIDVQRILYCRLVENGDVADAQAILDGLPEEMWPSIAAQAQDPRGTVQMLRCRRAGEKAVVSARAAMSSKDYHKAIVDIDEAMHGLDIRDDAELCATLWGIKSLAYLDLELVQLAQETSRRAIEVARGSGITKVISEAEIVRQRLLEHNNRERKKWIIDFFTRYMWLIIGASGAGSLYTLGTGLVKGVRSAFRTTQASRLTAHMRNTPPSNKSGAP